MTTRGVAYHELTVSEIDELTSDAVAITFAVPDELRTEFDFTAGQHVAVRADVGGEDVRRTYSVCTDPAEGRLRIGVKRIDGGLFSTYATTTLRRGDRLEVAAPHGEFAIATDPQATRHYGAVAAGSGITPILSMVAAVLNTEPDSRFTLLYGNRTSGSIMFLDDLEGLKDRYPDRFHLVHILSQEAQIIPALSGRIDADRLAVLFSSVLDVPSVDAWYLCGPLEMVQEARRALRAHGVAEGAINDELFFAQPTPPPTPPAADVVTKDACTVTFTLDGRTASVAVDPDGDSILTYALEHRRDTPFSCRGGMCTTCKAQVLDGEARMDLNFALTDEDIARGYILTCQAHPVSSDVTITYDV